MLFHSYFVRLLRSCATAKAQAARGSNDASEFDRKLILLDCM